jgi:hypothetical protein
MSQPIIPPINKTIELNYSFMDIKCLEVILFTSARFTVIIYDASFNRLPNVTLVMSGEDYANWQGDDAYVTAWVTQQLQTL